MTRRAMTFVLLQRISQGDRVYGLFGTDAQTNPREGDTLVSEVLGLLAVSAGRAPRPRCLPAPTRTPGGAVRGGWSGCAAHVIPQVVGTRLRSRAEADAICAAASPGARMATFHEAGGWDFWAEVTDVPAEQLEGRFWVAIADQNANPWSRLPREGHGARAEDVDASELAPEAAEASPPFEQVWFRPAGRPEPTVQHATLGVGRARALFLGCVRRSWLAPSRGAGLRELTPRWSALRTHPVDTLESRLRSAADEVLGERVLDAPPDVLTAMLDAQSPFERSAVRLHRPPPPPAGHSAPPAVVGTLELPWRIRGAATTPRIEHHLDGRSIALRLPVHTGVGFAAAVWDAPTGRLLAAFEDAVDIRFGADGVSIYVLYPEVLRVLMWPSLELDWEQEMPWPEGSYADRLSVDAYGMYPRVAAVWHDPIDGVWGCAWTCRSGAPRGHLAIGETPPADPIWSPEGRYLLTASSWAGWWNDENKDKLAASVSVIELLESRAASTMLYVSSPHGFTPDDPAEAERMPPLAFEGDDLLVVTLPHADPVRLAWSELLRP